MLSMAPRFAHFLLFPVLNSAEERHADRAEASESDSGSLVELGRSTVKWPDDHAASGRGEAVRGRCIERAKSDEQKEELG